MNKIKTSESNWEQLHKLITDRREIEATLYMITKYPLPNIRELQREGYEKMLRKADKKYYEYRKSKNILIRLISIL